MKQVIYNCDICNREIDKDSLISIKVGKNTKHFCQDCLNLMDIENLVQEKKDKR